MTKPEKQFFKDYTVVHRCYKCGRKLPSHWINNSTSGDYYVGDFFWSEIFDTTIPYHDQIICNECFDNLSIFTKFKIQLKGNIK